MTHLQETRPCKEHSETIAQGYGLVLRVSILPHTVIGDELEAGLLESE